MNSSPRSKQRGILLNPYRFWVPTIQPPSQGLVAMQIRSNSFVSFAQQSDGTCLATGVPDLALPAINRFKVVPELQNAYQIVLGYDHVFAQLSSGNWVGMGMNGWGSLGLGHDYTTPYWTPIPALDGAVTVAAGTWNTYAKFPDGSWSVVGYNNHGALGVNTTITVASFQNVPALFGAEEVIVGSWQTLAKFPDGSWKGAGDRWYGGLGLPDANPQKTFINLPALQGATFVSSGQRHTYAKLANGAWAVSGDNNWGQQGLGWGSSTLYEFTPVPALATATMVMATENGAIARMQNGTWWGTGGNNYGQLGLGNYDSISEFVELPDLAGALIVLVGCSANQNVSIFALKDGVWLAAGSDGGKLGLGPDTNWEQTIFLPVLDKE